MIGSWAGKEAPPNLNPTMPCRSSLGPQIVPQRHASPKTGESHHATMDASLQAGWFNPGPSPAPVGFKDPMCFEASPAATLQAPPSLVNGTTASSSSLLETVTFELAGVNMAASPISVAMECLRGEPESTAFVSSRRGSFTGHMQERVIPTSPLGSSNCWQCLCQPKRWPPRHVAITPDQGRPWARAGCATSQGPQNYGGPKNFRYLYIHY
jgi:hypothetical protein